MMSVSWTTPWTSAFATRDVNDFFSSLYNNYDAYANDGKIVTLVVEIDINAEDLINQVNGSRNNNGNKDFCGYRYNSNDPCSQNTKNANEIA